MDRAGAAGAFTMVDERTPRRSSKSMTFTETDTRRHRHKNIKALAVALALSKREAAKNDAAYLSNEHAHTVRMLVA